jgi:peptidoglycan/LPS O-acetylase OafA/YrhL
MSDRVASLDFLRGAAAFAVAIPHFCMARQIGSEGAETISILAVEIFFVLSGYVLAPQLLQVASLRNLGIFLVRRWMRTVPPYLLALLLASITAHQLFTDDFVRYAFYIQNLFHQANTLDYFSIAWSLSVEEWFYLTFPLVLLLTGGRCPALAGSLAFIAIVTFARYALADWTHWGSEVRRVVAFRVDAIAWGFLLYLATTRTSLTKIVTPGRALLVLAITSAIALDLTLRLADSGAQWIEVSFHLYASAFGASAVLATLAFSYRFERNGSLRRLSLFLGRISYSVYLFHLLALSALSRLLGATPWPIALVVYLAVTCGVAALMAIAVEAPVLAARPRYRTPET